MKLFPAAMLASLLVMGCEPNAAPLSVASVSPEQIKQAMLRAETPAGMSTVEFKEFGDTKRNALIKRLIRSTWDQACEPASLQLRGYNPNGSSQWVVHCEQTVLAMDYLVTLPERARANARVLKCYAGTTRVTICNLFGGPPPTSS